MLGTMPHHDKSAASFYVARRDSLVHHIKSTVRYPAFATILMESQRSRQAELGTQEMARTAAFESGLFGSQQSRQEDTEGRVGTQGMATSINNRHLQAFDMAAAFAAVLVETRGSSQYGFGTRAMAAAFAAGMVFGSKRTRQQDTQDSEKCRHPRWEL
jgi:hypothetical protein